MSNRRERIEDILLEENIVAPLGLYNFKIKTEHVYHIPFFIHAIHGHKEKTSCKAGGFLGESTHLNNDW
jgi:hypothetical protein